MNANPLSHVGQTARPEGEQPLPDDGAGDAGAPERQQNPGDEAERSSLQHPPDPDSSSSAPAPGNPSTATAATGPATGAAGDRGPGAKGIKPLQPGEAPPESSAGS